MTLFNLLRLFVAFNMSETMPMPSRLVDKLGSADKYAKKLALGTDSTSPALGENVEVPILKASSAEFSPIKGGIRVECDNQGMFSSVSTPSLTLKGESQAVPSLQFGHCIEKDNSKEHSLTPRGLQKPDMMTSLSAEKQPRVTREEVMSLNSLVIGSGKQGAKGTGASRVRSAGALLKSTERNISNGGNLQAVRSKGLFVQQTSLLRSQSGHPHASTEQVNSASVLSKPSDQAEDFTQKSDIRQERKQESEAPAAGREPLALAQRLTRPSLTEAPASQQQQRAAALAKVNGRVQSKEPLQLASTQFVHSDDSLRSPSSDQTTQLESAMVMPKSLSQQLPVGGLGTSLGLNLMEQPLTKAKATRPPPNLSRKERLKVRNSFSETFPKARGADEDEAKVLGSSLSGAGLSESTSYTLVQPTTGAITAKRRDSGSKDGLTAISASRAGNTEGLSAELSKEVVAVGALASIALRTSPPSLDGRERVSPVPAYTSAAPRPVIIPALNPQQSLQAMPSMYSHIYAAPTSARDTTEISGSDSASDSTKSNAANDAQRDSQKARENDRVIMQRLQEAKALDRNKRMAPPGAIMHKFSLWGNVQKAHSTEAATEDAAVNPVDTSAIETSAVGVISVGIASKAMGVGNTPPRVFVAPAPLDLDKTPQMRHGRKQHTGSAQPSVTQIIPLNRKLFEEGINDSEQKTEDIVMDTEPDVHNVEGRLQKVNEMRSAAQNGSKTTLQGTDIRSSGTRIVEDALMSTPPGNVPAVDAPVSGRSRSGSDLVANAGGSGGRGRVASALRHVVDNAKSQQLEDSPKKIVVLPTRLVPVQTPLQDLGEIPEEGLAQSVLTGEISASGSEVMDGVLTARSDRTTGTDVAGEVGEAGMDLEEYLMLEPDEHQADAQFTSLSTPVAQPIQALLPSTGIVGNASSNAEHGAALIDAHVPAGSRAEVVSPTLSDLSYGSEEVAREGVRPTAPRPSGAIVQIPMLQTSELQKADSTKVHSPLRWKRGALIGEGTFGKVYKGMNERTGELLAVKQLSLMDGSSEDVASLQKEISVMWHLDHSNIVRYLGTARSDRFLFIVLEYVSGGSIANMLQQFGPFIEKLIRRFTLHILSGVDYLHGRGIVHRDIKGANVLVSNDGVAKLADFGCSKQLAGMCTASLEESMKAIRGSVPWMAPEVIKQSGYGRPSDIWSVGATVIEMGTGKAPWPEFTNNLAALFHVATSKAPPVPPAHFSNSCAAFLNRCMQIEPSERATAAELLASDAFVVCTSPTSLTAGPLGFRSPTKPDAITVASAVSVVGTSPSEEILQKVKIAYENSIAVSELLYPDEALDAPLSVASSIVLNVEHVLKT